MSDKASRPIRVLRDLTNVAVLTGLLVLTDAAWAWWYGSTTVSCRAAWAFGSESSQMLIGMGGPLLAMLGVMLGGARHPLTGLGLFIMVAGLILSGMAPALLEGICGAP